MIFGVKVRVRVMRMSILEHELVASIIKFMLHNKEKNYFVIHGY